MVPVEGQDPQVKQFVSVHFFNVIFKFNSFILSDLWLLLECISRLCYCLFFKNSYFQNLSATAFLSDMKVHKLKASKFQIDNSFLFHIRFGFSLYQLQNELVKKESNGFDQQNKHFNHKNPATIKMQ